MQRHCRFLAIAALAALSFGLAGCQSSYVNSTAGEAMRAKKVAAFSHPIIARAYNAKPAIRFPATIALAPQGLETTTQLRVLDAAGKLDALKNLPQISAVASVSSLMYADSGSESREIWNKSDVILREAAAKLHADAVWILKIETSVTDGKIFGPLSLLTLGTFPNDRTEVIATAMGALVDTRTGYVYATAERSAGRTGYSTSYDSDGRDRAVNRASKLAMEKLFGEIPATWQAVVAKHRK